MVSYPSKHHEFVSSFIGIRNFIVQVTVEVSSDEARMRREKGYLNKLNLVLVQVRIIIS